MFKRFVCTVILVCGLTGALRGASRSWFGNLSVACSPVSESAARAFLAWNAQPFGLDATFDGLDLAESGQTPMGTFFTFRQKCGGEAANESGREHRTLSDHRKAG